MRNLLSCAILALFLVAAASAAWTELEPINNESQRPEFRMLEHSSSGDRFEMTLPGIELTSTMMDGKLWDRVEIIGGGYEIDLGKPEVPHVTRLLAIPARSGVRVEARVLAERIIPNIDLMPAQGRTLEETQERYWSEETYRADEFYPQTLALAGEPAIMRDIRVVPVQINPVSYNPVTQELRIATQMEIEVVYEGVDLRNVQERAPRPISESWGNLMRSTVVNFDDAVDVDYELLGSYLIICVNAADLLDVMQSQFIDWKRRKGHTIVIENVPYNTNTTTIFNVIQNAYDTWEVPPEYVLLVGDNNGSYALPGYASYVWDYPYSLLAGGDLLPEVSIGRLPAENFNEALAMFNKILWYEKQPATLHDEWISKSLLVAGSGSSGLSTILTNRWIKTRMLEHEFTQIDTFWYNMGGSAVTTMANSMNSGVSYFNYRGYLGMSGWDNGDTDNLTNGFMLPFVTTLTCGTGGFSSNSIMEHFVTVGSGTLGKGAVACVGTATSGTNTRCNNCVDIGMYQGLFNEDIWTAGTSLVRGKIELFNAYIIINSNFVNDYSNWNNLAGDPGLELYTGPIQYMQAVVPDNIDFGDNVVSVQVEDELGNPLEGVTVCVYKESEVQVLTASGPDGWADLTINPLTAGNLKITLFKHNYKPIIDSLDLVQQDVIVGYYTSVVDDDNIGESLGDADGLVNPGETIELPIVLKNYGSSTVATDITLNAACADPLIQLGDALETFANLAPGGSASSQDDIDFRVSLEAQDGHLLQFELTITTAQGTWDELLEVLISAPNFECRAASEVGGDSIVAPGETAEITINALNLGTDDADGVTAVLRSLDPLVTVNDSIGDYGQIPAGTLVSNYNDTYNISTSIDSPPGWPAELEIELTTSTGFMQTVPCHVTIGTVSSVDPTGPDEYGYWCFDDTDVNYPLHPTYNWIEIDPDFGGSGTELAIYDYGEEQDASINIPLPINFVFYGMEVDTITVCTNGWLSTVPNVSFTHFRNWQIPSALGPDGMIAPFWDDLTTNSGGRVYAWHDEVNNLIVIEWSRMPTLSGGSQETFEAILYDADSYPTSTGDSEILFQYHTIVEVSGYYWDNAYETIGIESPDQTMGIEVVYSLFYKNQTIAHVQNQRAYFFTTDFDYTPPGNDLQVTMTPVNPPITIPVGGGSFDFTIDLENSAVQPLNADTWISLYLPNGSQYGPVLGPINLTLGASSITSRTRTQNIPGNAPAGEYEYVGYIGTYNTTILDSSSFSFTKSGADLSGGNVGDWSNYGEPLEEDADITLAPIPDRFSMAPAYPNPFNPTTTLSFALPEAARVTLDVFDISGRTVATLVDGYRDAGYHDVTFDATGLASGIYFYRLQSASITEIGKMILMK
ncbi:MAG: C25 family cysteine peptidase [bacterium]